MALNLEVDAIHTDNIVSVNVFDTESDATNVATAQKWSLPATQAAKGWIVPGSVKIIIQAEADATWDANKTEGIVVVTDHVKGTGTVTFTAPNLPATSGGHFFIQYKYFKADALRRYTAGAVPTTLRYRNDNTAADVVIAESDDGTNWLQVGGYQIKAWEIQNFGQVTQWQLRVASTSGGRLIGSPISAI